MKELETMSVCLYSSHCGLTAVTNFGLLVAHCDYTGRRKRVIFFLKLYSTAKCIADNC